MDINQTAHSLRLGKFLDTLKASGFFMLLVLIAEALLIDGVLRRNFSVAVFSSHASPNTSSRIFYPSLEILVLQ